jgi:hypothetical protein
MSGEKRDVFLDRPFNPFLVDGKVGKFAARE